MSDEWWETMWIEAATLRPANARLARMDGQRKANKDVEAEDEEELRIALSE